MQNSEPNLNTKINWKKYNQALAERANIFSFIPENIEELWYNKNLTGKRGTPKTYSDWTISWCLSIGEIYRLPLRQVECFINNLFTRLKLAIASPDYTILSRRRMRLNIPKVIYGYQRHDAVLIDSSGMKIAGDGEWHREYHDVYRRKLWLKVHLGVSWKTRQIIAVTCTPSTKTDGSVFPEILKQLPKSVDECIGDGAYDTRGCYLAAKNRGLKAIFSIRSSAVLHQDDPILSRRNQAILFSKMIDKKTWKKYSGYHRRSLAENAFFRLKTIFGPRVSAKKFAAQIVQIALRVNLLNRFTFKKGK